MSKPVAVVVGAGPGLGSALARRFAVAGMAVAVARRREAELKDLAEETGGRAYACDATDGNSVEALFDSVERDLGTPALVAYNYLQERAESLAGDLERESLRILNGLYPHDAGEASRPSRAGLTATGD